MAGVADVGWMKSKFKERGERWEISACGWYGNKVFPCQWQKEASCE